MRRTLATLPVLVLAVLTIGSPPSVGAGSGYTIVGWNNLGMHCMDADYSVFSILPPYNTLYAQLSTPAGTLVRDPNTYTVTYEAVADPAGSINSSSIGKTNFWAHALDLFGADPSEDMGLAGHGMPGTLNVPQAMTWDPAHACWVGEGIPITPTDDAAARNPYPMMRLTARDGSGALLATTDVVLPVSDEMDCRACHASGSGPAARPAGGWINDPDPQIDYRKNILLLHDDKEGGTALFSSALSAMGYDPAGLYATAVTGGKPILCAACHSSNALGTAGATGVRALTRAVHGRHSGVLDPVEGTTLGASTNRSACYRCHPGSTTRCLRGVMGASVAANGTLAMQCQSCHGDMSAVGDPARQGWLDEPTCQNCHTGTAIINNGQIRYTNAFDTNGLRRVAADATFATTPDAPAAGLSLYRFSIGHGGLMCEACHGPTHAESPSTHANDNVQNVALQGHAGPLVECSSCHGVVPATVAGGPHGMHPVGQAWVGRHADVAEQIGTAGCQDCHGGDYRGTVLSYSQADRVLSTTFGTKTFWRGFQVGCYACHKGPSSETKNPNRPAKVTDASAHTPAGVPVAISLTASDPDGNPTILRIVSQPSHGTASIAGTTATYHPEPGYEGADAFTFAAWDGSIDSNLGTGSLSVGPNTCSLTCSATVPGSANEGSSISFAGVVTAPGCTGITTYAWTFGDGQTAAVLAPTHTYPFSGSYDWSLSVAVSGQACTQSGTIHVAGLAPTVTKVRKATNPLRIVILGSNFHPTIQISIDGLPWTKFTYSATKLVLKGGSSLKALFPAKSWVRILLVNPDDDLSETVEYNITSNQWRPLT